MPANKKSRPTKRNKDEGHYPCLCMGNHMLKDEEDQISAVSTSQNIPSELGKGGRLEPVETSSMTTSPSCTSGPLNRLRRWLMR